MIAAGIGDDMRRVAMLCGATVLALVTTGGAPAGTKPLGQPVDAGPRCATAETLELSGEEAGYPTPLDAAIAHLDGSPAGRLRTQATRRLLRAIRAGTAIQDRRGYTTPGGQVGVQVSEVSRGYLVTEFWYPTPC